MTRSPDFDYASVHFPDSWRIMDVRLLAYKAGHKLILERERSPLVCRDAGLPDIKDLVFALWVCSQPWKRLKRYRERSLSLGWRCRIARIARECNRDPELFVSRVLMFQRYVAESNEKPKRMRDVIRDFERAEPEITYAPALMILKRDLLGHSVCSEEAEDAFFDTPLRKLYYERWAQLERDGEVSWPEAWEGR